MKVWINVGAREAILAGKNETGWKTVDVDMGKLSMDEREYVASAPMERFGVGSIDAPTIDTQGICAASENTEDEAVRLIRIAMAEQKKKTEKRRKEEEVQRKAREEKIAAILGKKPEGIIQKDDNGYSYYDEAGKRQYREKYSVSISVQDARLDALYAEAQRLCETKNVIVEYEIAAIEARKAEAVKIKKAADEEIQREKDAQIKKWVDEKGTENQKKRYEIGLLPETEVIDAIRSEVYTPLDSFPRYEKMRSSDICTCENHYNDEGESDYCGVEYSVDKADNATADEYEMLERIAGIAKKINEKAVCTMMVHTGTSADCENEVERKSVKIELAAGAFKFSREYAI